ncbi:Arylsulfatase precursor [Planctomycetes bacterium Pan216]|uniref:Arylsulfatase n=1 Tax=Kolteria novifilia TaxID=2527975 RepID=A0A518B5G7_9BACT|nr:Arylsulfatase precursor [Planctomycetes bacterium Pan216]
MMLRDRAIRPLLIAAMMLGSLDATGAGADERPPNVIIVMSDDQGYGELSCHGNPILQTPHLDRLASQSIRLNDFHVAPMCTPTRGQLLTGLDAFRNGAMNVSSGRTLLRPELRTMADYFRAGGYRTGIFGKWHLGDNFPYRPEDRGFDETLWFPSSHINSVPDYWDNDYFDDTYVRNGARVREKGYCTDVFFREAMEWIASQKDGQPFFVYLPLNAAHWPHFVPERYREPIREAMKRNADIVDHLPKQLRVALVSFLAMCANIDENMGRLDDFLEREGLADDTIVIFLTDNGSTMGEKYFNAGMRGKKVTLWEGGHRVPCFVRWPAGDLGAAREVDELTQVQDLLPTLAECCGLSGLPTSLDGTSLAPLLRGEVDQLDDRMLVINYSRMPGRRSHDGPNNRAVPRKNGAAVLWKNWRLLEGERLYDLRDDPHQDRDVASQHPDIVQKMRAHLDDWWAGVEETAKQPQRVVIGHEADNPTLLTACEWLDVFVDQQAQIRRGVRKNGVWHLIVDHPGHYEFELRRWPRESRLKLAEAAPEVRVTDGTYVKGSPLPIREGAIRIGSHEARAEPGADGESVTFTVPLAKGPTELQTSFLDESGNEVTGAYFVYVNRK